MQVWRVLRGCLLAYAVGVVAIWLGGFADGALSAYDLLIFLIFGLLIGGPIIAICIGVWAFLAAQRAPVAWWLPVVVGVVVGLIFWTIIAVQGAEAIDGGAGALVRAFFICPLAGVVLGGTAWLGAFGLARRVELRFPGDRR